MAVGMEVVPWRGAAEVQGSRRRKRAWGADAQELMQLMMGQMTPSRSVVADLTLNLLGRCSGSTLADGFASRSGAACKMECVPEFHQLCVPHDDNSPLPPGWQKCLDLQTRKLYYVNRSSRMSTFNDPRKRTTHIMCSQTEAPNAASPLAAHEFLGSRKSETLQQESRGARASSSSSSSGLTTPPPNTTRQHSTLELDLNLSPSHRYEQTVCTMEMVQDALKRAQKQMPALSEPHSSGNGAISVSTSSSSSTSSRSSLRVKCEAESMNADVVMGACTRCLMYVMLRKGEMRCPRCDGQVPVEFGNATVKSHRRRVGLHRR